MRGASALGDLLDETPRDDLRIYAVWMPVLDIDTSPPAATTTGSIPDRHVKKRWDPERTLAIEAARVVPRSTKGPCRQLTGREEPEAISWDCVLVFEPGTRWEKTLPAPSYVGGPVVRVIDEVRSAIDAPPR